MEIAWGKSIATRDDYIWCERCNSHYRPETEIWFCAPSTSSLSALPVSFLVARLWPASWIRNSLETRLHRQLIQVALRDPLTERLGRSIIELINYHEIWRRQRTYLPRDNCNEHRRTGKNETFHSPSRRSRSPPLFHDEMKLLISPRYRGISRVLCNFAKYTRRRGLVHIYHEHYSLFTY